MIECDKFAGRLRDLCEGKGRDGRRDPTAEAIAHFRDNIEKYPTLKEMNDPNAAPKNKKQKPDHVVKATTGPGTELRRILHRVGLKPVSSCACESWEFRMNEWGVDGCIEHKSEIVSHLTTAYHATTWLQCAKAAAMAVREGIPFSISGIVDMAIETASNKLTST